MLFHGHQNYRKNTMEKNNEYFAVIFTATGTKETLTKEYQDLENYLYDKAKNLPGFIDIKTVKDSDLNETTISYWKDMDSIHQWARDPEHTMAKQQAPGKYYNNIKVEISKVIRSY